MAITEKAPEASPRPPASGLTRRARWLRFGSNVGVALVLATLLAGFLVWISSALLEDRVRGDWTASGRFSLSDRTLRVLETLEADVALDVVYPDPGQYGYESPVAREIDTVEYDRVRALAERYAAASDRITAETVDPLNQVQADAYLKELQAAFSKGFERKQELLAEFVEFRDAVDAFIEAEIGRLSAVGEMEPAPPPGLVQSLTSAANELVGFSARLQRRMLGEMLGATVVGDGPEPTLDEAQTLANKVAERFGEFPAFYGRILEAGQQGRFAGPIPDEVKPMLQGAAERFDPLGERAEALTEKLAERSEEKFDEIEQRFEYRGKFLVVRGPEEVQVLGPEDVWVTRPGDDLEGQGVFGGQRAVTSALLAVTRPRKPGVLFVTYGGPATQWGGRYQRMAERLRDLNFLVEDWDLLSQSQMPQPENMSRAVLVLVPPPPRNPQRPMPPPQPEAYEPALEAIRGGVPALVMAEMTGFMAPPLPYQDLFEQLGADPRFEAVAVHKVVVDADGSEQAVPQIQVTEYPPSPITTPLGALPSFHMTAVPVPAAENPPQGVETRPLVLLPEGPDYWAETNAFTVQGGGAVREPEEDLIPTDERPVPLVMAVTRSRGEEAEPQRLVLFGDSEMASNDVAFYRDRFGRPLFPGNAELFANCALWAAGMDDLLAVSTEAMDARRIGEIPARLLWQIILIGVLPLLLGAVGVVVVVLRRR